MVAHEQGHAVARLQARCTKLLRQVSAALSPLTVGGHHFGAMQDGRPQGVHAGLALQQMGKVQFNVSSKGAAILNPTAACSLSLGRLDR
jgi:hypothetical protein